jgi:oligopeptide/dipeptide ABC transporter ATP-binding protein
MTMAMKTQHLPAAAQSNLSHLPGYDPAAPALEVTGLQVEFTSRGRTTARVVSDVSYQVAAGQTLAVIGESGCGKSITARAVMGILPPQARVTAGRARLHGVDLLSSDQATLRRLRGRHIAMIFQDSLSALNPVLTVGFQIAEVFRTHQRLGRREADERAVEMLELVRIPAASRRAREYPHQFSGGMRQRVMIAMALAMDPDVLVADEPTTALDVTVQAQIMELLAELQQQRRMALILITHDLGVVADRADKVAVMYAGRIVENAPAAELYDAPRHPYTRALLKAAPRRGTHGQTLTILHGAPPDLSRLPQGCAFRPRCVEAVDACAITPPLHQVGPGHASACHHCTEGVGDD